MIPDIDYIPNGDTVKTISPLHHQLPYPSTILWRVTYGDVQDIPRLDRPTLRLRLGQQRQESKRREEIRSRVDPISIQPSLECVRVHLLRETLGSLGAVVYVGVSLGYAVV